jgi:hypothetical protein
MFFPARFSFAMLVRDCTSARLPPAIPTEVPMRVIGVVIRGASLVLALRAVETRQALRELGDALVEIRC